MKRCFVAMMALVMCLMFSSCFYFRVSFQTPEDGDMSAESGESPTEKTPVNQTVVDELKAVLQCQEPLINEEEEELYLNEVQYTDTYPAELVDYAVVDLDQDGINELIVCLSENYVAHIVLHFDGEKVYGYLFGKGQIVDIKEDGTFMQWHVEGCNYYGRLSFEKCQYRITYLATYDSEKGEYTLGGNTCTEEEYDAYMFRRNMLTNVRWIPIKE